MKLNANVKIALGFAAFVAVWMSTGLLSTTKQEEEKPHAPTPSVVVSPREAQLYHRTLELVGRTEAEQLVRLSTQIAGEVVHMPFEKGQKVRVGDLLAELDAGTKKEELAAATAQVKAAEALAKAARNLSNKGFQSATAKTSREADLAEAERVLAQAQFSLENTQIFSPIDGVVEERLLEEGDFAQAGTHVLTVLNVDEFLLTCFVPQKERGYVEKGSRVKATLASGQQVEGVVRFVAKKADEATQTYRLEAVIDARQFPGLTAGMTARVNIPLEKVMAHYVPHSALVLAADGAVGVMVAEQNQANFLAATVLEDDQKGLWLGGLPEHLNLITTGQAGVRSGSAIRTNLGEQSAEHVTNLDVADKLLVAEEQIEEQTPEDSQ